MAVPTNLQIGMAQRSLASAHKQKRKVNPIEVHKANKLERFAANCVCKSLALVKCNKKEKNYRSVQWYFDIYHYLCNQNLTILQMNNY